MTDQHEREPILGVHGVLVRSRRSSSKSVRR
jgi:hypothetical protein